mgnify:CR=1 FL=1
MVTTSAPGSSGGINLADISRDFGGGGNGSGSGGMAGVAVSRVASSIGGAEGPDRPLAAGNISPAEALKKGGRDTLTAILTYHVVPGKVTAAEVVELDRAGTVNGEEIDITVLAEGVRVNQAAVIECTQAFDDRRAVGFLAHPGHRASTDLSFVEEELTSDLSRLVRVMRRFGLLDV